jgi:hypothetical protein
MSFTEKEYNKLSGGIIDACIELVNFNVPLLTQGIRRKINGYLNN